MNIRLKLTLTFAVLTSLLLAACTPAATSAPPTEAPAAEPTAEQAPEATEVASETVAGPIQVALIVSGSLQDQSWNQWFYDGLQKVAAEPDIEVTYAEGVDPPDFERVATDFAAEGFDLILGHNNEFQTAAFKVAEQYPDTYFAITGGWQYAPNVAAVEVEAYQAAYLVGMLAGSTTESNVIGVVGGFEVPDQVSIHEAYKLGAKEVNPDIEILETFTGTWWDPAKGFEAATGMMDANVDRLLISLSGPGLGVIQAADERNQAGGPTTLAFGMFTDMNALAPDTVVTSVIWDSFPPVMSLIEAIRAGTFEGKTYREGMAGGAVQLAPYYGLEDKIPQEVRDRIDQAAQDILSGALVVPEITTAP